MRSFSEFLKESKLKGNQHKIDVDNDGKITEKDFEKLRNNKEVKKEYVDEKGKLVDAKTSDVADYTGRDPKKPIGDPKAAPFKPENDETKSPTIKVDDDGLANMGDEKLKYEPKTEVELSKDPAAVSDKDILKVENFINKTKNMSASDFANFMLKECGCGMIEDEELPYVTSYSTGKFQPHPPETIKYIVVLANRNENILNNMIHEMKNSGMLGKLIRSLLSHPEAYDELTALLGDDAEGPSRCKLFAKSMNNSMNNFIKNQEDMYEAVSSPIGFDDEDMEDMEDMDDEDMEDMDDEDMEDMDDEDMEDMDDEDMEDMEDMDDEDMEDMDDEDMEDMDDEDMEDMDDEDMEDMEDMPKRKLKKKFAHNNLIDAMKEFGIQ